MRYITNLHTWQDCPAEQVTVLVELQVELAEQEIHVREVVCAFAKPAISFQINILNFRFWILIRKFG